jgi:predicted nucleotidyltransferase
MTAPDLSSTFEAQREAVIARLLACVRDDDRLLALWLQGSLADGSGDPLSDIDAYVAVRDDVFDEVYAEREALIARAGSVLAVMDGPALRAIHVLLEGPVKLDLFYEPASGIGTPLRPAVRVLLDKAGVAANLRTGWRPPREQVVRIIDGTLRGTTQGGAWPLRMIGRGQWTTLARTELELVNDQLALLMAAQVDPALLFKNKFSLPRLLPPAQRDQIEALGTEIIRTHADRDLRAMRDVHLRITDAIFREGRAACTALDIPYPLTDAAEAAMTRLYVEAWPLSAP